MEYLSFDIECCDAKHICEFGYVVFDEDFRVTARECLTLNPEHPFTVPFRQPDVDFTLAYAENVYRRSPTFPALYPKIRALLENPGCRNLGFALGSDRSFLDRACSEYGLKKIRFSFTDFQPLYRAYALSPEMPSVSKFVSDLGIGDRLIFHKSDEDAFAVYLGIREIAKRENIATVSETLSFLQTKEPEFEIFLKERKKQRFREKLEKGDPKTQKVYLSYFLSTHPLNKSASPNPFRRKTYCLSGTYFNRRFNESLALIRCLSSSGAAITFHPLDCHFFILSPEGNEGDRLFEEAKKLANSAKRNIRFYPFDAILDQLGITEQSLSEEDLSEEDLSHDEIPDVPDVKSYAPRTGGGSTIGDLLRASGFDMSRFSVPNDDE